MTNEEAAMSLGAILSAGLDPSDVSVTLSVRETQALRLAIAVLKKEALTAGVVSGCKHPPRQDGSGSSRDTPPNQR